MASNRSKFNFVATVVACFVALALATNDFSFARSTQLHPVLQQIRALLNEIDIGVFYDSQAPGKQPARVGLLEDMVFNKQLSKARLERQSWAEEFRRGAIV